MRAVNAAAAIAVGGDRQGGLVPEGVGPELDDADHPEVEDPGRQPPKDLQVDPLR